MATRNRKTAAHPFGRFQFHFSPQFPLSLFLYLPPLSFYWRGKLWGEMELEPPERVGFGWVFIASKTKMTGEAVGPLPFLHRQVATRWPALGGHLQQLVLHRLLQIGIGTVPGIGETGSRIAAGDMIGPVGDAVQ